METKQLAKQLRKPEGAEGEGVADMMSKVNANFYNLLPELLGEVKGSMLEIGMGGGGHIKDLAKQLCLNSYEGWDYSDTMIQLSKKKNSSGKFSFRNVDLNQVIPTNKTFDLILMVNTIYFFEDLARVVSSLKELLNPGAYLVIGKRTKEDMEAMSQLTQNGFTLYSDEEVAELMYEAGFVNIRSSCYADRPIEFLGKDLQLHSEFVLGST